MRSNVPILMALVLCALQGACGSLPAHDFEHSTRAGVKRVELLAPGMPEHAQVRIMNPVGAGFGLVGNFVESRRAAGASQEMESTLAAAHFDFRQSLTDAIAMAVGKVGFVINRDPQQRPEKDHGRFLSKYPAARKIDAYLDVVATYVGFEAPQSSVAYRPRLEISARLVRARDNRVLFQDRIVYGCVENTDEDVIMVRADEGPGFRSRAALSQDPTRTARALQSAIDATAWELAKQFK